MSVSFNLAMIMRRVEVRAGSPAFMEAFIWSVNWDLSVMLALLREITPLYYAESPRPGVTRVACHDPGAGG
jgi:hypothetical protein